MILQAQYCCSLFYAALIGFVAVSSVSSVTSDLSNCLGAPYLYLTVNGNTQILKYSRDGCLLDESVLLDTPEVALLRSLVIGTYEAYSAALYIADAGRTDHKGSKILVYSDCDDRGRRHYLKTAITQQDLTVGMHAYGLALDRNGSLYSSFQRAEAVFRFSADNFAPMPLPLALEAVSPTRPSGMFFEFSYKTASEGVRAIAFVGSNLWVVDERTDAIAVVDSSGYKIREVKVRRPIGIYYDASRNLAFISSRSSYGVVYSIHPETYKVRNRFHSSGMTHPTGVVTYENTLFVLLHKVGRIDTFDIETGQLLSTIIAGFKRSTLEQVTLSYC